MMFSKVEQVMAREAVYGRQEGEQHARKEVAREMKKDGISTARIAKYTKLSVEEIEKLSLISQPDFSWD
ncbi:MAG: hypothetical protein ACHQIM_08190 [Sphingobacteriales bacterium]